MRDYIDPAVGIPLAIILWLLVVIMYLGKPIKRAVDDWAAQRRHNRRMRKFADAGIMTPNEYRQMQNYVANNVVPINTPVRKRGRHRAGV
jgi:hypothetical protein